MKMVLPTDGHRSASAFMAGMQDTQGDAFWLLKAQGHWHGGIHLFERFAPDAVYRPDAPKGQGLKSMTDGHIVAYRLNDDYLAAAYRRQSFLFSSTFILLKSACVPDKAQPENGLDFYTLWMQIAPLSVYGAGDAVTAEVIASALKVRRDNPAWGWVREGLPDGHQARGHTAYDVYNRYAAPQDTHTLLPRHSVVDILAEAAFLLESKAAPFVYARVVAVPEGAASGLSAGECGWISGQGAHLKRRGGLGALPPLDEKRPRERRLQPGGGPGERGGDTGGGGRGHRPSGVSGLPHGEPHHFCHLETFSQDSRLPAFVANRAGVSAGEALIHSAAGKTRYHHLEREDRFMAAALGDDPLPTVEARFTRQSETRRHRAEGKEWVYIPRERAWLAAEEVSVVHQFDLAKRGFVLLEQQDPPRTLRQTPGEGWLRRGFHRLAELARQNTRDMDSLSYIEGYQRLLREMGLGEEGQISGDALWRFLHNRQPHIQNQVQRLIVKHHSEWLHDGLSALWRAALDEQAKHQPDLARYNREFVDALVWMREVPEIRSGEALWHLHPIRFLEAISERNACACNRDITLLEELCAMAPGIKAALLEKNLLAFNNAFSVFEINTCISKVHLLAQILHESGGLIHTKEIQGELKKI
ncbi:hypothetical protein ABK905_00370 [Acerihabitans sp. KWT182]|uniref:Uncharacterized protein n=1 Tax=Acerihabitans sp. KWT182 TaxID=3157919 RepID=A0AAU7QA74_9GAMM